MSLVPTREEKSFADGYQQASEAAGMVIDHLMNRIHAVETERAVLRASAERLLKCWEHCHITHQPMIEHLVDLRDALADSSGDRTSK